MSCAAVHSIEFRRTPCQSAAVDLMAVWRSAPTAWVEHQHGQINVCSLPPTSHRPSRMLWAWDYRIRWRFLKRYTVYFLTCLYQNWNVQQFPVCVESAEWVYQAISRKDRQTTNFQSVALGWTEYYDLMNGKWASSFGFEMLCVSVGQINWKG